MKTILIPVDFSETSTNAIRYAAELSKDTAIERIILLKSCYLSVYAQLLPSADFVQISDDDIRQDRQKDEALLNAISKELVQKAKPGIKVETAISDDSVLRAIHQMIEKQHPGLVLIGSANPSHPNESYIGQQAVAIAKTSPVPVLIVPSNAQYQKIENALVPCDFTAIARLGVLKEFAVSPNWPHPHLMVLNVDPKELHLSHMDEHISGLKNMLGNYDHQIYYSAERDTVKAILQFATEHNAQVIIALPGRYSFFYNFTHRSITAALSQNARKPVLILK